MTDIRDKKNKSSRKGFSPLLRLIILAVSGIFLISSALVVVRRITYGVTTGQVLREAKLVRVASDSVSKAFYAEGREFSDPSSFSGLTPGAEEEIRNLSECEGVFSVLSFDGDTRTVTGLFYGNDGYAAVFDYGQEEPWTLYKEQIK